MNEIVHSYFDLMRTIRFDSFSKRMVQHTLLLLSFMIVNTTKWQFSLDHVKRHHVLFVFAKEKIVLKFIRRMNENTSIWIFSDLSFDTHETSLDRAMLQLQPPHLR